MAAHATMASLPCFKDVFCVSTIFILFYSAFRFVLRSQLNVEAVCIFLTFAFLVFFFIVISYFRYLFLKILLYFGFFSFNSKKWWLSCEWIYQSTRLVRLYGLYLKNTRVLSAVTCSVSTSGGSTRLASQNAGSVISI
ncbi:hypothetical protein BX070DRAFT_222611 [Coemansia spiralis]|nr:hypothetical protein BX070DRAFT_222611 [Coemansia spiralis]